MRIHDIQALRIGVKMLTEDLTGIPDAAFRPAPRAEVLAAAQEAAELAASLAALSGNLVSHARAVCAPERKA